MMNQILETWQINNRVNLLLIDAISDEALTCTLSKRGGNTVAQQFAHLHNMRLLKLERHNPDLAQGLTKLTKTDGIDQAILKIRLSESADAISRLIASGIEQDGNIRGFKRGVVPLLGYFISHESHHRGNILLTLKQSGHALPRAVQYRIWAWNQI